MLQHNLFDLRPLYDMSEAIVYAKLQPMFVRCVKHWFIRLMQFHYFYTCYISDAAET